MSQFDVTRSEQEHTGRACYRAQGARVTVLCPYGHLITVVEQWADSNWSIRASWGDDVVTCRGMLAPDAKPYPFKDTFVGDVWLREEDQG